MRLIDFLFGKNKTKKRGYEGASKSKRLSRWKTTGSSPNQEIWRDLATLRNRSRDLRRNNPYAARGIQVITSNVVGPGIQTQFIKPGAEVQVTSPLEERWYNWANTPAIDYDGRHNIFGLQRLINDCLVESGEVLVRRRVQSNLDFPVQYQILEPDFLDATINNLVAVNGNKIIQGIEFDSNGKRVAYHLFETHPGGNGLEYGAYTIKSNRVPASEVRHVFRMDRPGQARGVPWLAPCIIRMKDLDDFEDAQLTRQKIAACFVAFIRDIDPNAADLNQDEEPCDNPERVEPGIIENLPANKQVEFGNPPTVENYKEFVTVHLHAIAAGLGITYSALTGDLSQVNFSSGRMGHLEFQRNLETWRKEIIIGQFMEPVVEDFRNFSAILGAPTDGWIHKFISPRREMIDPTKEVPAAIEAIKAGLSTLSEEIMSQGKDPAEQLVQYQNDMQLIDKLKLTLTSDARNDIPKIAPGQNQGGGNDPQN